VQAVAHEQIKKSESKMKKIDWKDRSIELVVVFIGIYAAFLLNNWQQNQRDAQLELKYLHSLKAEVAEDFQNLSEVLTANERKLNKISQSIRKIQTKTLPEDSALVLLGDILSNVVFYPRATTYESIKYSGNLNLIRNYELREKIVAYYESFGDYKLQQQLSIDFTYDYAVRFAFDHIDLATNRLLDRNSSRLTSLHNLILAYSVLLEQNVRNEKNIFSANQQLQTLLKEATN